MFALLLMFILGRASIPTPSSTLDEVGGTQVVAIDQVVKEIEALKAQIKLVEARNEAKQDLDAAVAARNAVPDSSVTDRNAAEQRVSAARQVLSAIDSKLTGQPPAGVQAEGTAANPQDPSDLFSLTTSKLNKEFAQVEMQRLGVKAEKVSFWVGRLRLIQDTVRESNAVLGNPTASEDRKDQANSKIEAAKRGVLRIEKEILRDKVATARSETEAASAEMDQLEEDWVLNDTPSFYWELIAGAELTEGREKFSELSPYVKFHGSSRFGDAAKDEANAGWNRLYGFFDVALMSLPTRKVEDPMGAATPFVESEKTASLWIGGDYRLWEWNSSDDGSTCGFVAATLSQGVHTFVDTAPNDLAASVDDTVNTSYGAGVRIGEYIVKDGDRNPGLYRWFTLTYGDYGQFGNRLWTIDGTLRFAENQDRGFFMGARAILGNDGDDEDVALVFGFNNALGIIAPIFKGIGKMFQSD